MYNRSKNDNIPHFFNPLFLTTMSKTREKDTLKQNEYRLDRVGRVAFEKGT